MNPLTLPEVRMLIGQFLATRDVLACLLVCRAWYQDYQTLLYRSIRLDETTLRLLPRETLRKHAPLIRHLVLMEPMRLTLSILAPWVDPTGLIVMHHPGFSKRFFKNTVSFPPDSPCSNLLSLDIQPSLLFRKRVHEQIPKHEVLTVGTDQYDIVNNDFWCLQSTDACIVLIQLNPWLQILSENWDDMSSFHRVRFANQFIRLRHNLVNIHLTKWEVTPDEFNMLIENSPKLKILRFSTLTIKNNTESATGLGMSDQMNAHSQHLHHSPSESNTTQASSMANVINLRHLKAIAVSHSSFQLDELHVEAPELMAISTSFSQLNFKRSHLSMYSTSFVHDHQHFVEQNHPKVYWNVPRLEKLICNRTERHVSSESIFTSPMGLKSVSLADYEIESKLVTDLIAAQGSRLENIRLACFSGISARDIRLILTRCPNLVSFHAPEIVMWAGDLISLVGTDDVDNNTAETSGMTAINDMKRRQTHGRMEEWACHKLERLSLYISLEPNTTDEDDSEIQPECSYQNHYFVGAESLPCGSTMNPAAVAHTEEAHDQGAQQQQQQQQQRQGLKQHDQEGHCSSLSSHLQERLYHHHHHHHHHHSRQRQQPSEQPLDEYLANHHPIYQSANHSGSRHRVRNAFRTQLSKLTRLRHLDLSGEHVEMVDHAQIGLPLTIESGMQSMATLKALEHITVTGWMDEMGSREIEWMRQFWPNLNRISLLKTNSPGRARFQELLAQMWPEVLVQDKDKDRKNGKTGSYCPPIYYFC
ncbi:hypothetical protein BGX31_002433 [Mortierella sp. GBA43]|nr:hypothetical protein BGX31_002433 [Mortierella sp. GBA43]